MFIKFCIFDINPILTYEIDAGVSKIGFSIKKHFYGTCFHGIWGCMGPEGGPSAKVFGRGRPRRRDLSARDRKLLRGFKW